MYSGRGISTVPKLCMKGLITCESSHSEPRFFCSHSTVLMSAYRLMPCALVFALWTPFYVRLKRPLRVGTAR